MKTCVLLATSFFAIATMADASRRRTVFTFKSRANQNKGSTNDMFSIGRNVSHQHACESHRCVQCNKFGNSAASMALVSLLAREESPTQMCAKTSTRPAAFRKDSRVKDSDTRSNASSCPGPVPATSSTAGQNHAARCLP